MDCKEDTAVFLVSVTYAFIIQKYAVLFFWTFYEPVILSIQSGTRGIELQLKQEGRELAQFLVT